MLHQYTNQQYSNLNCHYSPLDNCSHLLEQTFLETSKFTDLDDCVLEQNDFYAEDKYHPEMENECPAYDSTKELPAEEDKTESLVPTSICELLDQQSIHDAKDGEAETNQLMHDEQNNNNVEKSPTKNESYDYQKYDSIKEENDLLPFINLDVDTIINAPVNGDNNNNNINNNIINNNNSNSNVSNVSNHKNDSMESGVEDFKQKMEHQQQQQQLSVGDFSALCDDGDSGFRLPGFHQAFGSTEIGRFVHQKDFIEQIASPPTIACSASLPLSLPNGGPHAGCAVTSVAKLPPAVGSNGLMCPMTTMNGFGRHAVYGAAKLAGKSRYQKRMKATLAPLPAASLSPLSPASSSMSSASADDGGGGGSGGGGCRNACWNYEPSVGDGSPCPATAGNGLYYKRKDVRRSKSGPALLDGAGVPHPAYYNGVCGSGSANSVSSDDYYHCSASPSYYGTCSDYPNCEYYKYQQQQQQQQQQQSSQYHHHNSSNYLPSPSSSTSSSSPSSGSPCSPYYGASNGYSGGGGYHADEQCGQRLQPYPAPANSSYGHHNGQSWRRGERFFPYGDQFPYGGGNYKQHHQQQPLQQQQLQQQQNNSGTYMYHHQNYASSQSQYLQSTQQPYPNYGYNSHPSMSNYNYF